MRKPIVLTALCLVAGYAWSQDVPEYCLENDIVHSYLTDFEYPDGDYTYSKVLDYTSVKVDYKRDWPKPVPFSWTAGTGASSQRITVSENEDLTDSIVVSVKAGVSSYDLYNLIPQRTYYYKIESVKADGSTVELKTGSFKTTGTVRMIRADGAFNVRDMGGWKGLGGHPLRYGVLFRGSRLRSNRSNNIIIKEDGIEALRAVGIRAELDLRTNDEANNNNVSPLSKSGDVEYKRINDSWKSRIVTFDENESSIIGIQYIIDWFKAGKPAYFHCSVGADRTGTVAFLIGALCGMSENDLSKEFELTSFSEDNIGENLTRRRSYEGRLDDSNETYRYGTMIDKVNALGGNTIQRKIYNHLKSGINGKSISEEDLDWLIEYMVDYRIVKKLTVKPSTSQTITVGDQVQFKTTYTPADATETNISYRTLNEAVATVSETGLLTAVGAGSTYLYVSMDGLAKTVKITVKDDTGVSAISSDETPLPMFNAAGQQISAPTGIYIRNGKKYINK